MKPSDTVGITFVNAVVGRGVLNGVVNVQFGAFNFEPTDDNKVSEELVVACRLRMDRVCLKQTYDELGQLLALFEQADASAANGSGVSAVAEAPPPNEVH